MKKIIFFLIMTFLCLSFSYAQKITQNQDGNYTVSTDFYKAETGNKYGAYLYSFQVRDLEFLSPEIDTTNEADRGNVLILTPEGKALKVNSVSAQGNVIALSTDSADLLYTFYNDKVEMTVTNVKSQGIFRVVLNHRINLAKDSKGNYLEDNILAKTQNEFTFIRNRGGVKVSGDGYVFGPFLACYSSEFAFNPGDTKKIVLTAIRNIEENDIIESLAYPFRDIMVYTPQNYQVFQRESKEKGHININGKVSPDVTSLEYRISGKDFENKPFDTKWVKAEYNKFGSFNLKPEIRSGGWYKLELKYTINGKATVKTVENVGVGEIIVGAGQSNSTNCGDTPIKTETRMVADTDGVRWRIADDPLISPHDGEDGGSFWPALGDILYKEFNVPIGVVPLGWGGTKIAMWHPEAEHLSGSTVKSNLSLYDFFIDRIIRFGVNGFRCVLWHQGESDIGTPTYKYYNDTCDMIWASKRDAGWDIPWFTAKASFIPKKTWGGVEHYGFNKSITDTQQKIWDDGIAFEGPDTDTLQGDYRDHGGKGVHLSPKGLRKHAQMWSEFIIPFIHSQTDR